MKDDSERIWREECGGRCAILHLEKCPSYERGECKFPETQKAKELVFPFYHPCGKGEGTK